MQPPSSICIEFCSAQKHLRVVANVVAECVRSVLAAEGIARAQISIAVVDDAAIRDVNRRHLAHDWATDVVTFPLSDATAGVLSGELVVSAETALRVAREHGHDPIDELLLYIIHGLLHLCGFDDQSRADVIDMRRREAEHAATLGLKLAPQAGEAGSLACRA